MDFQTISMLFVMSGIVSAMVVYVDIYLLANRQPMRVMIWVWILTALWAGVFGLWAYYRFGKIKLKVVARKKNAAQTEHMNVMMQGAKGGDDQAMKTMSSVGEMLDMVPMDQDMADPMKSVSKTKRPKWQKIAESTLHCGAGCTLADLIGEWFVFFVPMSLILDWGIDYVLALIIGALFQYAAIRTMNLNLTFSETYRKAFKIEFWSLTAWQIGMYSFLAFAIFVIGIQIDRLSWGFWFMMQLAMLCGFIISYPMNALLIKLGIKQTM